MDQQKLCIQSQYPLTPEWSTIVSPLCVLFCQRRKIINSKSETPSSRAYFLAGEATRAFFNPKAPHTDTDKRNSNSHMALTIKPPSDHSGSGFFILQHPAQLTAWGPLHGWHQILQTF